MASSTTTPHCSCHTGRAQSQQTQRKQNDTRAAATMVRNVGRKAPVLLLIVLISWSWLCITASSALPFGTRGGKDAEEEQKQGDDQPAAKDNDDETYIQIVDPDGSLQYTSQASNNDRVRRMEFVESFFMGGSEDDLHKEIKARAHNMTSFLVGTRRALHQKPELMYQEVQTSLMIQDALKDMGIEYSTGWAINTHTDRMVGKGGYGIVADIGTGAEPCVLLRADIDALPILERTEGVDGFKSQHDGKMHACGHDGHTTMLLGAASLLKEMEDSINGTVRVMFQPAEEGGAGAKRMREEGVLQLEPKPQYAFGMHVWPTIPSGSVASRAGPLLAACDRFEVLISGVGGHAAMPHLTVDPIVAASAIVMNLQTIVSRTISPLESGVCSITKIEAGEAFNIIPASVLMRGTIRSLATDTLMELQKKVDHIILSTSEVYGCNTTITWSPDFYPATKNDPTLFEEFSKDVGASVSEEGVTRDIEPTMGAEDFAFVAENIPSTFFLLGQGSGTSPPTNYGLHHPHFALDESVLPRGVELHVALALRALRKIQMEQA